MRNGILFFAGLLAALVSSWAGAVLWPNSQLGSLAPLFDETEGKAFPQRTPGIGVAGRLVYEDLGCATCHTQQVRRPSVGSDKERGWGDRQSVARDYIYDTRIQLGDSRIGPDLANVGARKTPYTAQDLYRLLYAGSGAMPPYRFLFATRSLADREASNDAIALTGPLSPASGQQIVPTPRARELVAYLLSLSHPYEYPEARPVEPAQGGAKQ